MGYTNVSFKEPLIEAYKCAICRYALQEPKQTECGHRFCQCCIETKLSEDGEVICPVIGCDCFLPRDKIFSDCYAKRELFQKDVTCRRCGWEGVLKDFHEIHADSCDMSEVICTNNGCDALIVRKNLHNHLHEECDLREITCNFCGENCIFSTLENHKLHTCHKAPTECPHQCGAELLVKDQLDSHEAVCPLSPCECQFKELGLLGCTYKGTRTDVKDHESTSIQHHMLMIMKQFKYNQLEKEKQDLKLAYLERKLTEVQNEKALREAQCLAMRQELQLKTEQMNALTGQIDDECEKREKLELQVEKLCQEGKGMRRDLHWMEEQNLKLEDEITRCSSMKRMKDGCDFIGDDGERRYQVLKPEAHAALVGKEITSVLTKLKEENPHGGLPPQLSRFEKNKPLKGLPDDELMHRIFTLTGRSAKELLQLIEKEVSSDNLVLLGHLLIMKAIELTTDGNGGMDEEIGGAWGGVNLDLQGAEENEGDMQYQIRKLTKRVSVVESEMEKMSVDGNQSFTSVDLVPNEITTHITYSMALSRNLATSPKGATVAASMPPTPMLSAVPRRSSQRKNQSKTRNPSIKCFNCNQFGHIAKSCPSK